MLTPWQQKVVDRHPWMLLRGFVHSDGCRCLNRVWGGRYEYPRYFFTNHSDDIRRIFCDVSDALGIRYRQSNPVTISIARGTDVAMMDSFIGPER